jgi:hypothetical protein
VTLSPGSAASQAGQDRGLDTCAVCRSAHLTGMRRRA